MQNKRMPQKGDIYKNRKTGNLWHIAFILPEGYMLEHRGFHTRPLTSEELDAEFEFFGEPEPEPHTLYM